MNTYAQRDDVKYRYRWVTPMAFTPPAERDPLWRPGPLPLDGQGAHWDTISPDLTGAVTVPGMRRAITLQSAGAGAAMASFSAIAPSPKSADLIWVGTDNGLIQLTRDGGQHWQM